MTDTYTNRELGKDYISFIAISEDHPRSSVFMNMRGRISNLDIDLPTFYHEHGRSLADLQVEGIGKKTKEILESILDKGLEETSRIFIERRDNELSRLMERLPYSDQRGRRDDAHTFFDEQVDSVQYHLDRDNRYFDRHNKRDYFDR